MKRNTKSQKKLIASLERGIAARKTQEAYQQFHNQCEKEWSDGFGKLIAEQMAKAPQSLGDYVEGDTFTEAKLEYGKFLDRVATERKKIRKENPFLTYDEADYQARENMIMTIPKNVLV